MSLKKRAVAESIGTFWLVFGGCGSAVLAAAFPNLGIGFLGVALAFGLTVLTMAYAIGHISGCHLNPAVSIGLVVGRRFPARDLTAYVAAQVMGAIAATAIGCALAWGCLVVPALRPLYDYAWFVGFFLAGASYVAMMKLVAPAGVAKSAEEMA